MIGDRIVCGISDDRMQRHLLSELTLDFKKELEIAQSMEIAAKILLISTLHNHKSHEMLHRHLFTSFKPGNVTSRRTQTAVNI